MAREEEAVADSYRVILSDVIVETFEKQRRLVSILTFNEALH